MVNESEAHTWSSSRLEQSYRPAARLTQHMYRNAALGPAIPPSEILLDPGAQDSTVCRRNS